MATHKNVSRVLIMSLATGLLIAFMVSLSFAQIPGPVDPEKLQPMPVPQLPDLVVTSIGGKHCPDCTCGSTNLGNHPLVEFQDNIDVYVANQGRAASRPCTLRIEFYDVIEGRTRVIDRSVPRLEPGHGIHITERGEFLFRKSTGIRATIDSRNVVIESNERNNTKTVTDCVMVLR